MQNKSMIQLCIILICLIGFKMASAQSDYVVFLQGDTLYGEINYLNYGLDKRVQISHGEKNKSTYSMMQIKSFLMNGESYHLIKMVDQYTFMKPVQLGYLSLYQFQLENQLTWDGQFLYRLDGAGTEVPNLGFKKRMGEFLSDCSALATEIKEGKIGKRELSQIITLYNECVDKRTEMQDDVTKKNTPSLPKEKTKVWDELENSVRQSETLLNKETILEMITEAKSKAMNKEKIPNFIIDGLKKSIEPDSASKALLDQALKEENN